MQLRSGITEWIPRTAMTLVLCGTLVNTAPAQQESFQQPRLQLAEPLRLQQPLQMQQFEVVPSQPSRTPTQPGFRQPERGPQMPTTRRPQPQPTLPWIITQPRNPEPHRPESTIPYHPQPQHNPRPQFRPSAPANPLITHPIRRPQPTPSLPANPRPQPAPQLAHTPARNPRPSPPATPTPTRQNALPAPPVNVPENIPVSDRIGQASAALRRDVARDLDQLTDDILERLRKSIGQLPDNSGMNEQVNAFVNMIQQNAPLHQIGQQASGLQAAFASTVAQVDGTAINVGGLSTDFNRDLSNAVLASYASRAIAATNNGGSVTGGGSVFGPSGSGPIANGNASGPTGGGKVTGPNGPVTGGGTVYGPNDPVPQGPGTNPGNTNPGTTNPGATNPGTTNPGSTNPGSTSPGTNPGGTNPGAFGPGGFGLGGGFYIGFNLGGFSLGFGFGPIVNYPGLPAGQIVWIGSNVLVTGTGGSGSTSVTWGSPASVGLPYPSVNPLPNAAPGADYQGRILLLNPDDNGGEIYYLLDNEEFSMQPGMLQDLEADAIEVRFNRGPGFGDARYTLRPGTFKFIVRDNGWELVRTKFEATLDNSANAGDFHLLLDGETVTVPAGSQQVVTSDYPPVVEFDDGSGSDPVRKELADDETYTIGINDAGLWDLFPGDAVASGAAGQDLTQMAAAGSPEPPME